MALNPYDTEAVLRQLEGSGESEKESVPDHRDWTVNSMATEEVILHG